METVEYKLTSRQFNLIIDVLQDAAKWARGDAQKTAYANQVAREANDLIDNLLQQRMGL